jgi:hypothetical protein
MIALSGVATASFETEGVVGCALAPAEYIPASSNIDINSGLNSIIMLCLFLIFMDVISGQHQQSGRFTISKQWIDKLLQEVFSATSRSL